MMMYGVKKKSSDSQPYRAVHLGSVFIWGVTSSTSIQPHDCGVTR